MRPKKRVSDFGLGSLPSSHIRSLPLSGRVNIEWIKMSVMLLGASFMLAFKIIEIFSEFFMNYPYRLVSGLFFYPS